MPSHADLDARLDELSSELDRWTAELFQRFRPAAERFAGMLSYPLGWVGADLRPLHSPAQSGKRLRPALCLLVCEAVSGDHRRAMAPAAAIELVHNFSLVHDDIQDGSHLRRGRPTVWSNWQTAQAINVGDSLFALAQVALLEASAGAPDLVIEAARRLNVTCLRLVEGQYLDLELQAAGQATSEAYQTMIAGKTAALLEYAAWAGSRFGGAQPDQAERYAEFGRLLGLAFQIQDDLLGVWGDPTITGKPGDADLRDRKQALPAILALQARGAAADQFRQLFRAPGAMTDEAAQRGLALLEDLGIQTRVQALMKSKYREAEAALDSALDNRDTTWLRALLRRFRDRTA
jgi:geranylgeranyl diphosphate synthase type I